jgi:hypothetical protein
MDKDLHELREFIYNRILNLEGKYNVEIELTRYCSPHSDNVNIQVKLK